MSSIIENGWLKWWHATKAFGYINRPDGTEVFFHWNDVLDSEFDIYDADNLNYTVTVGANGKVKISNVKILDVRR